MFVWLFWGVAAVLGLIGIAMLVAGWELVRRNPEATGPAVPLRVHSVDLNLGDPTGAAGAVAPAPAGHGASLPTDSDARRRALARAIERMSEPARPQASKESWEDTLPRVNLPLVVERTPPA